MKKSELRQIIKEELLKEIDYAITKRIDGLILQSEKKKMESAVLKIAEDLIEEGFDYYEIYSWFTDYIPRLLEKKIKRD